MKFKFKGAFRNLAIIAAISIVIFIFSYFLNVFIFFVNLFKNNPRALTYIDEAAAVLLTLTIGFAIFSRRRWRELKKENTERLKAGKELLRCGSLEAEAEKIISKQLRCEIELRKKVERSCQTIIRTALDGFWIVDTRGHFLDINDAYCSLIGYSRNELLKMRITDVEAAESSEETTQHIRKIMEIGKDRFETRHRRKGGSIVDLEVSVNYFKEEGSLFVFLRDITERKQAEMALRESEERYRSLFENMLNGFAYCKMLFDGQGRPEDFIYLSVNSAFVRLTGLENVVGKKVSEVIPGIGESYPELLEIYGRVALTSRAETFEIEFKPLRAWLFISVYSPEKGYFVAVFDDITKRKQAEEILRRDNEALEKIVKKRSEELIGIRLEIEKTKRLADIGTLAATVAHELRNPLAAINVAAHNIERKASDAPIEKHLQNIEKKISESAQIINNLLFYSRIRPPHYENISLYLILKECVEAAKKQYCHRREILFKKSRNLRNDILIEADPVQLKEALFNILNNACDACSETGGKVAVLSHEKGDFVEIVIKDNGSGIERAHLENVFDPFFTTKAKGTGLGLTVCRQIVDMHGGSIRIESESGEGAEVFVTLPKKRKQA